MNGRKLPRVTGEFRKTIWAPARMCWTIVRRNMESICCFRSMSPQIIAVDELGLPEDFAAVADCARCGVSILGTIHAGSVLEVLHRLQMGGLDLIRSQMRLIGLQREPDGRRILTVYEGGGNPLWQGFSEPS